MERIIEVLTSSMPLPDRGTAAPAVLFMSVHNKGHSPSPQKSIKGTSCRNSDPQTHVEESKPILAFEFYFCSQDSRQKKLSLSLFLSLFALAHDKHRSVVHCPPPPPPPLDSEAADGKGDEERPRGDCGGGGIIRSASCFLKMENIRRRRNYRPRSF